MCFFLFVVNLRLPSKKKKELWELSGLFVSHRLQLKQFELNYVEEKKKISQKASSSTLQVSCQAAGTALWSADVTLSISAQAQIARVQAHHIPHIVGDRWSVPHQGRGRGEGGGVVFVRQVKENIHLFLFCVFLFSVCFFSVKMHLCLSRGVHERATGHWGGGGWRDQSEGGGVPAHMIPQRCEAINSL